MKINSYILVVLGVSGEIKGSIEVTTKDNKITLENINGYYLNLNNTFKLMLR